MSQFTSFSTPATYDLTLRFAQNQLKFTIHGIFMCWF